MVFITFRFTRLHWCIAIFMIKGKKQPKEVDINRTLDGLREKEKQLTQKLQSAEYMEITP